ncbi:MAG: hypothetical protein HOG20_02060 [Candidatus Marinimicrobia bacterium]|jgi:hypothetical protein|nr:hypothetical protein [Candidatus Neomarinimicrobiota bacterium]MBT4144633.1 hypothetical protein [Candidatus Neomarinimicrobiota bacterium]MBT4593536.1 hypothetical protein [Candidatus Neomarinimicrobiota bacterium]
MTYFRITIVIFVLMSSLFAEHMFSKIQNPCDDPIISKVRKNGMVPMSLKERIYFIRVKRACLNAGGSEEVFAQIELKEYNRDFGKAREMSSWTSTFSYSVIVALFYYFVLGHMADV